MDLCICGHEAHEHVLHFGTQPGERAPRCTVCTCDGFDWDDRLAHESIREQLLEEDLGEGR